MVLSEGSPAPDFELPDENRTNSPFIRILLEKPSYYTFTQKMIHPDVLSKLVVFAINILTSRKLECLSLGLAQTVPNGT